MLRCNSKDVKTAEGACIPSLHFSIYNQDFGFVDHKKNNFHLESLDFSLNSE
jgi:hypothetical protein